MSAFQSREGQARNSRIGPVDILSLEQQTTIIAALCDGCSIRAVERMTGVHRDTIMRLGVRVGTGALALHDRTIHSLQVAHLQLHETCPTSATSSGG
jgi:hypothetical protein